MNLSSADGASVRAKNRVPSLDALRAIAILLVLVFHYARGSAPPWFAVVADHGWIGVDLFFVLSGFLIARQLFIPLARGEAPRLSEFFARRFLRVLPAFWVVLAIYAAFPALREQDRMPPVWRFLTFTQNFGLELSAFSHAWSLCIEEHFYLLLPVLVVLLSGRVRAAHLIMAVAAIVGAGLALRGVLWQSQVAAPAEGMSEGGAFRMWIYYPTWGRLDGLLAGVVLAGVWAFRPELWARWTRSAWPAAAVMVAAFTIAAPLIVDNHSLASAIWVFPLISIGFAAFLVVALTASGARLLGALPGAGPLATITYCTYLSHKLVFHALRVALEPFGFGAYHPVSLAVTAVAVLVVAAVLHLCVERPFLRMRERWANRSRAALEASLPQV